MREFSDVTWRHVAIIDDDENFLSLMDFYLRKKQLELVSFSSARDAVESDCFDKVGITLVDLAMCDEDGVFWEYAGLELIYKLRDKFGQEPKIWALTGRDDPSALQSCLNNGIERVLFKHIGFKSLSAEIQSVVARATPS